MAERKPRRSVRNQKLSTETEDQDQKMVIKEANSSSKDTPKPRAEQKHKSQLKSQTSSDKKSDSTENTKQNVENVQKQLFPPDPIPATTNPSEEEYQFALSDDDDDEVVASDTETDKRPTPLRKTPNLRRLRRSFRAELTPSSSRAPSTESHSPELMKSFYEHSLIVNSPSVFSDAIDSPGMSTASPVRAACPAKKTSFVITPLELPPSYDEVLRGCRKLDIPEFEFQQPFYSDPADVSKVTEVGFLVLHIPGNKLNDCEPFQSALGNDRGLASWRRQQLIAIGGPAMLQRHRGEQRIREYFSSRNKVAVEPVQRAPTPQEAKVWLKAQEVLRQRGSQSRQPKTLIAPSR